MESILPPYKDFVKLELRTLKLLHDYLAKWAVLSHSMGLVKRCWSCDYQSQFQFNTYWNVENEECRLFLGAIVRKQDNCGSIADMSYYICIAEGTHKPTKVLRKFHFDYVSVEETRRQPHPRFHVQYCGGLPPSMESLGITKELMMPLLPDIEGPRIFFRPMTLGLLMNIAFHEFPCGDTDEIKKRGEWLNLVRENERRVLVPFYKRCAQLAGKDRVVFFDEAYVR